MATSYKQLRIASRLHDMGGSLGVENSTWLMGDFFLDFIELTENVPANMVPLGLEVWKMFLFLFKGVKKSGSGFFFSCSK